MPQALFDTSTVFYKQCCVPHSTCVPQSLSPLSSSLSVLQRPDRSNGAERGKDSKKEEETDNEIYSEVTSTSLPQENASILSAPCKAEVNWSVTSQLQGMPGGGVETWR